MITIGIPFYNDEKFLDFAIQSVFDQTHTEWKLILIGDGGTDGSLYIARKYESDPRVTVVFDGENRKLPYRLNQLIDMTNTKYMARMDADDIMHPKRIETQLNIMEENPDIDVLGTNAYTIDGNNNVIALRTKFDKPHILSDSKGFIHPSILGKSTWFKKNKYDEQAIRLEDLELWYRAAASSSFKTTSEPLMFYREVGNQYYKKYFNTAKSRDYILSKYKNNKFWKNFFRDTRMKGLIYYCYNLIGKEQTLVNRRNELIYDDILNYKKYVNQKD